MPGFRFGRVTPASSDVSDMSCPTPTVGVFTATFVPGSAGHRWQTAAAAGTMIGVKGAVLATKAMALTAAEAEALISPTLMQAAKAGFRTARGLDFHYRAMLGDRVPMLDRQKRGSG